MWKRTELSDPLTFRGVAAIEQRRYAEQVRERPDDPVALGRGRVAELVVEVGAELGRHATVVDLLVLVRDLLAAEERLPRIARGCAIQHVDETLVAARSVAGT